MSGRIATFYSYKGGVGRSMALANLAWVLASNGKRVLVVDMHLEAPGLHRYFAPFLTDPELEETRGVIEYLTDYVQAVSSIEGGVTEPWLHERANVLRYAVSLEWEFARGGTIDFVPAGRSGSSYQVLVNELSWDVFYRRLGGAQFLFVTIQRLREEYDYVLVDSPPGIGLMASLCTGLIPDVVVVCFVLNRQSVRGAIDVIRWTRQLTGRETEILPVPMRIDVSEKQLADMSRVIAYREFESLMNVGGREYWGGMEVPYVPFYSYVELLAPFVETSRREQSVLASIERLAERFTGGEISRAQLPSEAERRKVLAAFQATVKVP